MLSLTLALYLQAGPSLDTLNELAKKKDSKTLAGYSTGDGSEFKILRGGAYDVGRFGWKVEAFEPKFTKSKYVVFTTPLTSQDTGELLFERMGGKLRFISELDPEPIRLVHHKLAINLNPAMATISPAPTDSSSSRSLACMRRILAIRSRFSVRVLRTTSPTDIMPEYTRT